jgi:hypothetical protein
MNMLTSNRILQQRDEFLNPDGTWAKVPARDFGIHTSKVSPCHGGERIKSLQASALETTLTMCKG